MGIVADPVRMLPRMSTIRRYVVVIGVLIVCGWVWVTAPVNAPSDVLSEDMHNLVRVRETKTENRTDTTRQNTPEKVVVEDSSKKDKSSKLSHHHSNQTLEKLRKNMTLLKANMSGVESILLSVNKTKIDHSNSMPRQDQGEFCKDLKCANPHPYKYLINSVGVCKNKDVFLIVYVHTAPDHYKRRMVIRQTWGSPKYYDVTVRVVFVMGETPAKPELQRALLFESEQYGDVVQENFQDTYKNLTYKGVAGLKWISNYCSHAKFVLKTDDDIFVNMYTLLRHLISLDRNKVNNKGTLLCLVWYRMSVMRTGKWKVSEDQWKDSVYPTYCSGSAFTMTTDAAIAMHNVSYNVPFFWVDDFYITGLLPLKLNGKVKHKQFMSTYVLNGKLLDEKFTGPQWFTYIFSHVHDLNVVQSVWDKLVKLARGEVKPTVKYALPGHLPKVTPTPVPPKPPPKKT